MYRPLRLCAWQHVIRPLLVATSRPVRFTERPPRPHHRRHGFRHQKPTEPACDTERTDRIRAVNEPLLTSLICLLPAAPRSKRPQAADHHIRISPSPVLMMTSYPGTALRECRAEILQLRTRTRITSLESRARSLGLDVFACVDTTPG